jgi:hypothetical protein
MITIKVYHKHEALSASSLSSKTFFFHPTVFFSADITTLAIPRARQTPFCARQINGNGGNAEKGRASKNTAVRSYLKTTFG